jgi:hypothetical protein
MMTSSVTSAEIRRGAKLHDAHAIYEKYESEDLRLLKKSTLLQTDWDREV